jgi:hypothetical protein
MNPARWLAALFILTALAGCAPVGQKNRHTLPTHRTPTGNILATGVVMVARAAGACRSGGDRDLAGPPLKTPEASGITGKVPGTRPTDEHGKGELRFIYHNFRVFSVALSLVLSALFLLCRVPSSAAR